MNADVTVAELVALIDRQRKALSEGGRPDLAELCHVRVLPTGDVRLSFADLPDVLLSDPTVEKAMSIDPAFELGPSPT